MHTIFWFKTLNGRDHSEDVGVDEKIKLEWIFGKKGDECVDWMHLAQDRDQWRALANRVRNRPVT
jgi:hypothetical protein